MCLTIDGATSARRNMLHVQYVVILLTVRTGNYLCTPTQHTHDLHLDPCALGVGKCA